MEGPQKRLLNPSRSVSKHGQHSLLRITHRYFLPSFGLFGQAVSEVKNFFKIRHSETRVTCGATQCGPCLSTDRDEMSNLYRGPSIDAVIFITGKENGGNYRHLYSRLKDLILILHVLSSSSHLSISKVIGDGDFQIWALKW
jgi:hypothetical protein